MWCSDTCTHTHTQLHYFRLFKPWQSHISHEVKKRNVSGEWLVVKLISAAGAGISKGVSRALILAKTIIKRF